MLVAYSCRLEAGGALAGGISSRGGRDEDLVCNAFLVARHVFRLWRGHGAAFSTAAHDVLCNRAVVNRCIVLQLVGRAAILRAAMCGGVHGARLVQCLLHALIVVYTAPPEIRGSAALLAQSPNARNRMLAEGCIRYQLTLGILQVAPGTGS